MTDEERRAGDLIEADPWVAFEPQPPPLKTRLKRLHVLARHLRKAPRHRVIRPAEGAGRWALYFVYTADGHAYGQHRFTLERLHAQGFSVLAVVASDADEEVVRRESGAADALILKEMAGFDFSGYAIGLTHLVDRLGVVDVAVMNDSIFGPFTDLGALFDRSPWFLTGFTVSPAVEPHIQSYAFLLKGLDAARLRRLRPVLWRRWACNKHGPVSFLQETRFSRVAASAGPVGSIWTPRVFKDLLLGNPIELLDAGFPFLKRSLVGKFAADFDQARVRKALADRGHPGPGPDLFPGAA